jgi:hypothetical protein
MSSFTDDFTDDEPEQPPRENPNIKQLREKAERHDEAVARANAAERELAFAKAGIPLADTKMGYFVKGYDGELTPEAIRTAATEAGFIEPPAQPQQQSPQGQGMAAEVDAPAWGRMAEATAAPSASPPRDFNAEIAAAKSQDDVLRIAKEAGISVTNG